MELDVLQLGDEDSTGRLYVDLLLVVVLLAGISYTVVTGGPEGIRIPLAALFVFAIPGYLLTVALFPGDESTLASEPGRESNTDGITLFDRAILTVGLSLGTVVLVGVTVDTLPYELSAASILGGISLVTLLLLPVSSYRRARAPDRFLPYSDSGIGSVVRPSLLTIVLVLSVLFAGGAIALSTGPGDGDSGITEFYFLAEGDNRTVQTDDYPTNFTRGESRSLRVAIENREGRQESYTMVVQLQQATRESGTATVQERRTVHSSTIATRNDETEQRNITVQPTETGTFRLTALLYLGEPPAQPSSASAYREIHLWITVSEPTAGG